MARGIAKFKKTLTSATSAVLSILSCVPGLHMLRYNTEGTVYAAALLLGYSEAIHYLMWQRMTVRL
jgi:hypothetical protein